VIIFLTIKQAGAHAIALSARPFDYLNNTSTATKRGRIPDALANQVEENDPRERSYGSYLVRNEDI